MADFKRNTKEQCAAFAESDGDDTDDEAGLYHFGNHSLDAEMAEQKQRQARLLDYANNSNNNSSMPAPGDQDESEEEEGSEGVWLRNKGKEKNKNLLATPPSSPTSPLGFSDGINPSIFDMSSANSSTSYFGDEGGDDLALLLCSLNDGPGQSDDLLLSSYAGFQWKREGLKNLGNTCYMNAVLQGLFHLSSFVSDLLDEKVVEHHALFPANSVFRALVDTLQQTCEPVRHVVNPLRVKEAVQSKFDEFKGWGQQDAHEFLISGLDQLQEEVSALNASLEGGKRDLETVAGDESGVEKGKEDNTPPQQQLGQNTTTSELSGKEKDNNHPTTTKRSDTKETAKRKVEATSIGSEGKGADGEKRKRKKRKIKAAGDSMQPQQGPVLCATTDNFTSVVLHQLICKQCGKISKKKEVYRDFSLEIVAPAVVDLTTDVETEPISLQRLLEQHFMMDEREKKCRCGHEKANMKHSFFKLPRVLVLHLKRFRKNLSTPGAAPTITKLTDRVIIDDSIDVSFCCTSRTKEPTFPFRFSELPNEGLPAPPLTEASITQQPQPPPPSTQPQQHSPTLDELSEQLAEKLYRDQQNEIRLWDDFQLEVESVPPPSSVPDASNTPDVQILEPLKDNNNNGVTDLLEAMLMEADNDNDDELQEVLKKSREEYELQQQQQQPQQQQLHSLALSYAPSSKEEEDLELATALALSVAEQERQSAAFVPPPKQDVTPTPQPILKQEVHPVVESTNVASASPAILAPMQDLEIETRYKLWCAVMHQGATVQTGHYVCLARQPGEPQQFQLFDDELVTEMSQSTAFTEQREKEGYLFFYVHQSGL